MPLWLGAGLARSIFGYREEHGPFAAARPSKKVLRLGPRAFEPSPIPETLDMPSAPYRSASGRRADPRSTILDRLAIRRAKAAIGRRWPRGEVDGFRPCKIASTIELLSRKPRQVVDPDRTKAARLLSGWRRNLCT